MAGQRSVSIAELRANCVNLERDVLRRSLATEEELTPHRPGKEKNNARDAQGWLRYFAVLHRFHARGENSSSDEARARADAQVLAALRDEPIRVDLIQQIQERPIAGEDLPDPITHLYVWPKSLDALLHAHALDRQLLWLLMQKDRIEEAGARGMPRASELHEKVTDAISYTYGLLVWIMTSSGPEMPYKAAQDIADPELPDYVRFMHPADVAQVANAGMKHHARLAALQLLLDKRTRPEGKRPSWSSFVGSLAVEMGTDSVQIMKHRSLASLLAAVQLNADANAPESETPAAATRPTAGTLS